MPRWYEEGIRFTCKKCGVCCHDHGEYGFVFLYEGEPERIAAELGLSLDRFLEEYAVCVSGWLCIGNRGASCALYEEGLGCRVYASRPIQCSTWPFWPENLKIREWRRGVEKWCPGVAEGELVTADEIESIAGSLRTAVPLRAPPGVKPA